MTTERGVSCLFFVYLLYLDESGNESDAADRHFVLGGVAVFERQTFFIAEACEEIQRRHFPTFPPVDFHATDLRTGKGFWHRVAADTRQVVLSELLTVLRDAHPPQGLALFAVVVEKSNVRWGETAVEYAMEEICRRFDNFLKWRYRQGDPQRGLLILSEGRFHKRAKLWVTRFRELGTRWGTISNFCDIPYFASARENRLLQLADIVAHAVFLLYERRNPSLIREILPRFGQDRGTLHGLAHSRVSEVPPCDCPACASRSAPGNFGSWV